MDNWEYVFRSSHPVAATITGTAMIKEKSIAGFKCMPVNNPPMLQDADRDMPGISAKP